MYKEVIRKSLYSFKPVLFVPEILFLLTTILILIITLLTSGVLQFLMNYWTIIQTEAFPELFVNFLKTNLFKVLSSLVFFFIVTFVVGVSTTAMKFAMIRDIINSKKIKFRLSYGKEFFSRIVRLKVLVFLIYLIILFFGLSLINLVNYMNLSKWLILLAVLIFVLLAIMFSLSILFRYPVMFLNNKNAVVTLTESLFYTKNNKKHIVIVALILFLTAILLSFLTALISTISDLNASLIGGDSLILFITIFVILLNLLINTAFMIWKDIFLFYNFKLKKTIY